MLCEDCLSNATRISEAPLCRKCALPSKADVCEACFTDPPQVDRALAAFQYDGPMRDAVRALKYDDLRALAPAMSELMATALPRRAITEIDTLVPVPASANRLRSRGYNQASLLARQLSKKTGIPVREDLLRRRRDTAPQVDAISETARKANVVGVFQASDHADGKRLLLIDDVMTTGATLNACAAELKRAGAAHVTTLALCREL